MGKQMIRRIKNDYQNVVGIFFTAIGVMGDVLTIVSAVNAMSGNKQIPIVNMIIFLFNNVCWIMLFGVYE